MHLTAAIEGLQAIKQPHPVHFYTGSDYLRDGITRWVRGWQRQKWQTKAGKPVSNQDLWQKLVEVVSDYEVQWHLVTKPDLPEPMLEAKSLADNAARS
jgi:ribonuclease HI